MGNSGQAAEEQRKMESSMKVKMLVAAAFVAVGTLVVCGFTPAEAATPWEVGYHAGCRNGYADAGFPGYQDKDKSLYNTDKSYRDAYDKGYSSCFEEKNNQMQPG